MGPYPYPEEYKKSDDNSTFDKYLSRQTSPIEPQGNVLQRFAETITVNEEEERMHKYLKGSEYGAKRCFDNQFGQPGQSTWCFGKE